MRRQLLAVFGLFAIASLAEAADNTESRAIGYSQDWKYFAFEQYGIQDGSGFPYWEIYVIDLAADAWVKGTPVRVVLENEEDRLTAARGKAYADAKPVLDQFGTIEPASLLMANPGTEAQPDRTVARFDAYYNSAGPYTDPKDRGHYEISVKAIALPRPASCTDPDFEPMGMEVTLRNLRSGKTATIARDAAIPASRHCPAHYDIDSVYAPASYGAEARNVVFIGTYTRGFEGWDRQVTALPFNMVD